MSDYAKIENTQETRQNLAQRLGFVQDSALDALDRSKYDSDEAYLRACAEKQLQMETPEYRQTLNRISAEYERRRKAEEQKRSNEEYERLRKAVQLDAFEQSQVEKEARRMAERDLASGKISTSGLGRAIVKYQAELETQAKNKKAGNAAFNALIREKWRG